MNVPVCPGAYFRSSMSKMREYGSSGGSASRRRATPSIMSRWLISPLCRKTSKINVVSTAAAVNIVALADIRPSACSPRKVTAGSPPVESPIR